MATLGMILPMSFAPVIGEAVIEHWGYPGFWLLLRHSSAEPADCLIHLAPAPDPADNAPKLVPSWLKAEVFTDPLMFGILAVNFLSFMGQASMNNLIALYAEAQHLSPSSYF